MRRVATIWSQVGTQVLVTPQVTKQYSTGRLHARDALIRYRDMRTVATMW
jgi:hypothetical protein